MSTARIFDLGFRHYDGPRLGPGAATRSLARHTFGALIGRRRSIWAKLLTVAVAGIAFVPALVFLGLAVFIPQQVTDVLLPGSEEYLGFISVPVTLFVVLGAPQALCPDRRSGALALYLASPLDRDTYLLAKAWAVVGFLAIVTVGPTLLLIIGLVLLGRGGAPDGIVDVTVAIARAVASGLAFSLVFGALSMALSSLTDRRAAAAAATALFIMVSGAIVQGAIVETLRWPEAFGLLDVGTAAREIVARIHGQPGDLPDAGTLVVWVAAAAWVALGAGLTRWRYQRLEVTR